MPQNLASHIDGIFCVKYWVGVDKDIKKIFTIQDSCIVNTYMTFKESKIIVKFVLFSVLGWKSKGHFKSKGHSKSKGLKAFKGTKAKSYIHKGFTKRSAEPWWGHSLKGDWDSSWKGDYFKGHSWKNKGHSLKG